MLLIPVAAAPAIIVVILMFIALSYGKVLDLLNIPRSKLSYGKIIVKERVGISSESTPSRFFTIHKICFEIENFKILDLMVPKKTYESLYVGSKGVLVHTSSRFRGFHVDKKIPDIIKQPKKKSGKSGGWKK